MKRQLPGLNNSYQQNYQNPLGRNNDGKFPKLIGSQPRLVIDVAPKKGNMCVFHLTIDNDSERCSKTTCMMQLLSTNELSTTTPCPELDSYSNGDSGNLFLEYESDSQPKGECYVTFDGTSYTILTQGQKLKKPYSSHVLGNDPNSSSNNIHMDQGASTPQTSKEKTPFDFIQFFEESKIQISLIDYLKSHPCELKRLVDHCKGNALDLNHTVTMEEGDETLTSNLFDQEDFTILATSLKQKPYPFYISLYINGCKLRNCIID